MSGLKELTGQRFGRLVVVARAENDKYGEARWLCRCDCGRKVIVRGASLRCGDTKSCGCLKREKAKLSATTHGKFQTRLYKTWKNMKSRCYNPNTIRFSDYGCRGITVCEEWRHDFQAFYDWAMSHGYRNDLSIDRIDNDGPYSPENCRWTDNETQCNNRRSNHSVTFQGETHTIREWEKMLGFKCGTIWTRIKAGWPVELALTEPPDYGKKHPKKK